MKNYNNMNNSRIMDIYHDMNKNYCDKDNSRHDMDSNRCDKDNSCHDMDSNRCDKNNNCHDMDTDNNKCNCSSDMTPNIDYSMKWDKNRDMHANTDCACSCNMKPESSCETPKHYSMNILYDRPYYCSMDCSDTDTDCNKPMMYDRKDMNIYRHDDTNMLNGNAKQYINNFENILKEMIIKMDSAQLNNSISYNFIVQMIPHHMAAIEMSKNVLRFTTDVCIQKIANNIILEQTKSIQNMKTAICRCNHIKNSNNDLCRYQNKFNKIKNTMFEKMKCAKSSNQINCNFMWEMIPHHEGAVAMSSLTLEECICPELRPILSAIIESQKKGICEMEKLLKVQNCK